ncbi:hypothetical protein LSPH24S_06638 [Lysinibacillus sphaericus]
MVTITDNGVGMSEALIKRVYEPFYTTNSRYLAWYAHYKQDYFKNMVEPLQLKAKLTVEQRLK